METSKKKIKRNAVISNQCVACGTCLYACPFGAISIEKGVRAVVDIDKCRGCTKCAKACPASVITMEKREVEI